MSTFSVEHRGETYRAAQFRAPQANWLYVMAIPQDTFTDCCGRCCDAKGRSRFAAYDPVCFLFGLFCKAVLVLWGKTEGNSRGSASIRPVDLQRGLVSRVSTDKQWFIDVQLGSVRAHRRQMH